MIGYLLGCATVGVAWFFWPKLKTWLAGEETKVEGAAKTDLDKLEGKL
jgi:hypothetical protein